jgi:hypothetical protein
MLATTRRKMHNQIIVNRTNGRATVYFLFEMILVIACLMMTPAFSVSFFVNPLVTHTLRAGIESCDEDAVRETLLMQLAVCYRL